MTIIPQNIKKIIAIASGKGGVGKTTICLQLAQNLKKRGYKVGIVDADLYGPNIFAYNQEKQTNDLEPKYIYDIPCVSISYMMDKNQALMWRGPMIGKTVIELINKTAWTDLDILILDTPPGTGDIHLSLLSQMTIAGYILITNPHVMSKLDNARCKNLFDKYNIPLIATLSNLSSIQCPNCQTEINWLGNDDNLIKIPYHAPWQEGKTCEEEEAYTWVDEILNNLN